MIALIGSTGFIGSAFARALEARSVKFIALERDAIYNQLVDVVIDANGNSKKFIAEKHPHFDFQSSVASVSSRLTSLRYSTYVYLSSGEVYGVDQYVSNSSEDVCILEPARSYYGMHRRLAEFLVGAHAKRNFIFRLGGFTGNGLRKNPVYDIVNGNALFVHPDSAFQFMDVDFAANLMLDLLFEAPPGVYNICGRGTLKVSQMLAILNPRLQPFFQADRMEHHELNLAKLEFYSKKSIPSTKDCILNML
jgi:nucleoside-diphosphate-sugar epimerase